MSKGRLGEGTATGPRAPTLMQPAPPCPAPKQASTRSPDHAGWQLAMQRVTASNKTTAKVATRRW